jgi:hypothetical protein
MRWQTGLAQLRSSAGRQSCAWRPVLMMVLTLFPTPLQPARQLAVQRRLLHCSATAASAGFSGGIPEPGRQKSAASTARRSDSDPATHDAALQASPFSSLDAKAGLRKAEARSSRTGPSPAALLSNPGLLGGGVGSAARKGSMQVDQSCTQPRSLTHLLTHSLAEN